MNTEVITPIHKGINLSDGRFKVGEQTFTVHEAAAMLQEKDRQLRKLQQEASPETFLFVSRYLDATLPRLVKEASLRLLVRTSRPAPSEPLILPR